MDLRKIEYFVKVAETLNFNVAASELYISHQALSKQIRILEEDLGARLFERTTSRVSLTEVGKKMYDIFKPILHTVDEGYLEIKRFVKYKKETVRIGYFNGLPFSKVVDPVVQYILDRKPELRIEMLAADVGTDKELLDRDSIDLLISIMLNENDWEEVSHVTLFSTPMKILVSGRHPWYGKDRITEKDLSEGSLLVYENRPVAGEKAFLDIMKVRERIPVRNVDTYMGILSRGKAFGIVTEYYSKREGDFKLLDLPEAYAFPVKVIAAFKKLHPEAGLFGTLDNVNYNL